MDGSPNADLRPVRRPVGLIITLLLALVGTATAAGYAQWLMQERMQLQATVAEQDRRLLELREQLTRAEVAVQEKDAAVASRDVALAQARQPELPVQVSFRPAWMGQGMVATFRNVANQELTLMIEFRDPNTRASRDFVRVVASGASAEVGHAEGWLVTSGQSVTVSASGYKSVTAFAP